MMLPAPLSGFPPLSRERGDGIRSTTSQFGIDPAEVQEIARTWRAAGIAIHAADVEAIGAAFAPSSRVARALAAAARPARLAVDSIGERLTSMSGMLRTFDSTVAATDARSGGLFGDLADR
ncbi:hypothetical protein CYJ73_00170 [Gordonia terrae]|uniref:ESX-1 secretion-associated protein n=2 Tax=Gordonia terrae TaxID=2055 RepID=A0A2I1RDH3_9ACTN|nr:hypothetical protein [Gordonia terrae]PKZ67154.1 hypothetical protein CYJ73_00170 [Gordonia terrae]UPW11109.1 hypothetical protein M1C59_09960 [Gordonia terrae]